MCACAADKAAIGNRGPMRYTDALAKAVIEIP